MASRVARSTRLGPGSGLGSRPAGVSGRGSRPRSIGMRVTGLTISEAGSRNEPLRVALDARLESGDRGGVEQVIIGLAAGLSALTDDRDESLFLVNPEHRDWLTPYLAGPC